MMTTDTSKLRSILPLLVVLLGASESGPTCRVLPADLSAKIHDKYPTSELVNLKMLSREHRAMYLKEHATGCPGAVRLDFFGDGSEAYAALLIEKSRPESVLVLARRAKFEGWDLSELQRGDARPVPVIWKESRSSYTDLWKDKKLEPKGDVLVLAGYESWARVFGWDGVKSEWVQVSD